MNFRRLLFWTHLVVGALTGLVVLLMSVTGVILAFEVQLNEWARRDYRAAAAPTAPLSADRLVEIAAREAPEGAAPSSLLLSADPLEPAAVGLGRGRSLYLDRAAPVKCSATATAGCAASSAAPCTGIAGWRSKARAAPRDGR